jgi:hypothetical protein
MNPVTMTPTRKVKNISIYVGMVTFSKIPKKYSCTGAVFSREKAMMIRTSRTRMTVNKIFI